MKVIISRELDTEFERRYYSFATISEWQKVWRVICDMAYRPSATQHEEIMIYSSDSDRDDSIAYSGHTVQNQHLICIDEVWRSYDKEKPFINKNLKCLYVPRPLFYCLGVHSWFKFSFPNCEIVYWPE
jgi:hypothetical protein